MRLAVKFALAVSLGIVLILVGNGVIRLRREIDLFESDSRHDHQVLGGSLRAAVERVWAAAGRREAMAVLPEDPEAVPGLRIAWVDDPALLAPGALGASAEQVDYQARLSDSTAARLVSYFPVRVAGVRKGWIEVSETLLDERRYLRRSKLHIAVVTLITACMCSLLALLLGALFVGRPIRALGEMARRIGSGDLTTRADVPQQDEIGELAADLGRMAAGIQEARAQLEEESAARLATVDQLRHAERLSTVGKLAAGLAHELGTPLNVVIGRARLVRDEPGAPDVAEHARIIGESATGMTRIIRQLLDFARRRAPRKEPQDLVGVVRGVADLLAPMAAKAGVALEVREGESARVSVDAVQIQQALANLVVNAIQATRNPAPVVMEIGSEQRAPPADLGGGERRWARVDVHDRGEGIAPEVRARIFEPFFTTKRVGEGTGLGLSVCWGIAREHGGWIDVRSEPGAGSTFTLYLPAEENA